MFHKRFTTMINLFLGLLLVMHALIMSSSAHAHQDEGGLVVLNGGRKVLMGQKEPKEIARVDIGPSIGGFSKISGVTSSDGNSGHFGGKRGFNGKSWSSLGDDKIMDSTNNHGHGHGYKKGTGFVAFSADYHGPKRHSPKHN